MADLSITPSQVQPDNTAGAEFSIRDAGEVIDAGEMVYLDGTVNQFKLADANDTAAAAEVKGLALSSAASGQPVQVQTKGSPVLGAAASVARGTIYVLSINPGKLRPAADLGSSERVSVAGVGDVSDKLKLGIFNSEIQTT